MKAKALLPAAAATLLLTSCHWVHGDDKAGVAKVCTKKDCYVAVTVRDCTIRVDPPTITISGNRDVEIFWDIVRSPGVTFAPQDAVFFKPDSIERARLQFSRPQLQKENTRFRWLDANNAKGEFNYGVRVVQDGKACPPLDPIIINDM
jgi:hypothetical protein